MQALLVDTEPFLADKRDKIVGPAARYSLPAVYQLRTFAVAGGLASYGTSITDANRQLGIYPGRVLAGTKAGDLPVMQSTKFELVINSKTAKALGVSFPPLLLPAPMKSSNDRLPPTRPIQSLREGLIRGKTGRSDFEHGLPLSADSGRSCGAVRSDRSTR